MRLTTFTDFSLRVLIYLKLHEPEKTTVVAISNYFQISQNHVVKVVNNLANLGIIDTHRGKGGGITVNERTNTAKIGDLVKLLEPDKDLIECSNKDGKLCAVSSNCKLSGILSKALNNFYQELNQYTLNELVKK